VKIDSPPAARSAFGSPCKVGIANSRWKSNNPVPVFDGAVHENAQECFGELVHACAFGINLQIGGPWSDEAMASSLTGAQRRLLFEMLCRINWNAGSFFKGLQFRTMLCDSQ
jgi:hypothetical protein